MSSISQSQAYNFNQMPQKQQQQQQFYPQEFMSPQLNRQSQSLNNIPMSVVRPANNLVESKIINSPNTNGRTNTTSTTYTPSKPISQMQQVQEEVEKDAYLNSINKVVQRKTQELQIKIEYLEKDNGNLHKKLKYYEEQHFASNDQRDQDKQKHKQLMDTEAQKVEALTKDIKKSTEMHIDLKQQHVDKTKIMEKTIKNNSTEAKNQISGLEHQIKKLSTKLKQVEQREAELIENNLNDPLQAEIERLKLINSELLSDKEINEKKALYSSDASIAALLTRRNEELRVMSGTIKQNQTQLLDLQNKIEVLLEENKKLQKFAKNTSQSTPPQLKSSQINQSKEFQDQANQLIIKSKDIANLKNQMQKEKQIVKTLESEIVKLGANEEKIVKLKKYITILEKQMIQNRQNTSPRNLSIPERNSRLSQSRLGVRLGDSQISNPESMVYNDIRFQQLQLDKANAIQVLKIEHAQNIKEIQDEYKTHKNDMQQKLNHRENKMSEVITEVKSEKMKLAQYQSKLIEGINTQDVKIKGSFIQQYQQELLQDKLDVQSSSINETQQLRETIKQLKKQVQRYESQKFSKIEQTQDTKSLLAVQNSSKLKSPQPRDVSRSVQDLSQKSSDIVKKLLGNDGYNPVKVNQVEKKADIVRSKH